MIQVTIAGFRINFTEEFFFDDETDAALGKVIKQTYQTAKFYEAQGKKIEEIFKSDRDIALPLRATTPTDLVYEEPS